MQLVRCGWCNMQILPKSDNGHVKASGQWWCCVAHYNRYMDERKERAIMSRHNLLTPNFMPTGIATVGLKTG